MTAFICFVLLFFTGSVFSLPVATAQNESFSYIGFSKTTNTTISLNGIAEIEKNGMLRLTNDTSRLIGRAFHPDPVRLKPGGGGGEVFSFSTDFAFAIRPEYATLGGHGFAFVMSPSTAPKGGLPSQYFGLLNSSDVGNFSNHIFFVEFDTVQDFEFGDINDNHVGININDMRSNASSSVRYTDSDGAEHNLTLKSGTTIQAWVDYDGEGKVLNVTVSPSSTKPTKPLLSFPLDLSPILHETMYVGFSGSTGLLASSHYLFGWNFATGGGGVESLSLSSLPSLPIPDRPMNMGVVVGASVSSFFLLVLAALLAAYVIRRIKNADIVEPWELQHGPHRFSYDELRRATKGFREKELLGSGGFGKVYKGKLPTTGADVAVKRVSHGSKQGLREFVAEIASIGRLRHRNLVQLQGWCRRRADLLLVYDFMPNGSLDSHLFVKDAPVLSWPERFRIIRGVASALLYLHEEWEHVVIHRDVKASNVLLDADMNGRLGDFGLAKLHDHGANPSTTRVVGTVGYLAPELARAGKVTTSSDVFAFGATVLEVVCGRRPIEAKAASPDEMVLVDWLWEKWTAGVRLAEVVDGRLEGDYHLEEVELAVKVGLMCSHPAAAARPTMREVVGYLDGNVVVPEIATLPGDYQGRSPVGFDHYLHCYESTSCPSSWFQNVVSKTASETTTTNDGHRGVDGGGGSDRTLLGSYAPLSLSVLSTTTT